MKNRVALVGASGIGRHHGKWWALEGADVCAFVGSTPESAARTRGVLEDLFGFSGVPYHDLETMLRRERPDVVDICTPPHLHAAHVRTALEAGRHVLCEKPFVYDASMDPQDMLAQARALCDLAREKSLVLSVCTQYSAGAAVFARIWRDQHGDAPILRYHGHLESPAKGREPDPVRVWVDLAPHVISVLTSLFPGGAVLWDSLETTFRGYEALACFNYRAAAGNVVACELFTRNRTEPPSNVRHFRLNGELYDVQGGQDDQGVYCARIATPGGEVESPDMMRLLIRDYLGGAPCVGEREALANLEIMLGVMSRAR